MDTVPNRGRKPQNAAVTVLDVRGWTLACSSKPTVSTRICRLIPFDLLARIVAGWIQCRPPFFRAFHALAVNHAGCWARLPTDCLAALHVQRIVDLLDRSPYRSSTGSGSRVACCRGGSIVGEVSPLAAVLTQYITPFTASRTTTSRLLQRHALAGGIQRAAPISRFLVGQVTRVAQTCPGRSGGGSPSST